MLLYSNGGYFRLCFQLSGSVLYQKSTIGIGMFLCLCNIGIQILIDYGPDEIVPDIPNNYGVATLGMVVAFASVFRTNLAWQRYWESLSQVRYMYSKCEDAFSAFAAFSRITVERALEQGDEAKANRVQAEYDRMRQYFSWMSALAVDRITHGCTNRMDRRREVAAWNDQIITLKELHQTDLTGATNLPELFVGKAQDQKIMHTWANSFVVSALPSKRELDVLSSAEDRVGVIVTWILGSLSHVANDLDVPPPIQSRVYQEISNAMVGFQNCVKIADVPFPFPYAQLLAILVSVFAVITPFAVACFTRSFVAGPIFTMVVWSAIWCVNEVAKELENPFGMDVNDICLEELHSSFMGMLEETAAVLDVQRAVIAGESSPRSEFHEAQVETKAQVSADDDGQAAEKIAVGHLARVDRAPDAGDFNTSREPPPAAGEAAVLAAPRAAAGERSSAGTTMMPADDISKASASQCGSEVKQRKAAPQAFGGGAGNRLSNGGGPLHAVHVIDSQLAQISIRMESQLAQIAKELEALSVLPAIAEGRKNGFEDKDQAPDFEL